MVLVCARLRVSYRISISRKTGRSQYAQLSTLTRDIFVSTASLHAEASVENEGTKALMYV